MTQINLLASDVSLNLKYVQKTMSDQRPAWADIEKTCISRTCDPNEDCDCKADQEQHEDQHKMPFRQSVEPHGGQSITGRHYFELKHKQKVRDTNQRS